VFIRPKTLLLLGPEDVTIPDYNYATIGLEARSYGFEKGETAEVVVYSGKGTEKAGTVLRQGDGKVVSEAVKLL
jgi:hypothetical protein